MEPATLCSWRRFCAWSHRTHSLTYPHPSFTNTSALPPPPPWVSTCVLFLHPTQKPTLHVQCTLYTLSYTSGISIISGIILGTSFGHMALLALGILRPFPRTRPLASSKTIVDSLSIDLDLPLSRLVSRKLSRIRLHDQDKVDHLCLFDLLRDFRNRGTGVGGGATRTCKFPGF